MFNAHWATLGGGEQLAGGIAAALARQHDVELLVDEPFDAARASERLGFALTGLPQREINPGKRSFLDATEGLDLLVNTSFASTAAHRARHGVYYVHFPVPDGRAEGWDALWWRRGLPNPLAQWIERSYGFWLPEFPGQGSWTMGDAWIDLVIPRGVELEFGCRLGATAWPPGRTPLAKVMIDDDVVFEGSVVGKVPIRRTVTGRGVADPVRVHVESDTFVPRIDVGGDDDRHLGVVVSHAYLGRRWPKPWPGSAGGVAAAPTQGFSPEFLESYDTVLANSPYTARWTETLWGRSAEVLPPPVQLRAPGTKRNLILSVGRFFPPGEGHCKKQLELVQAFRAAREQGLDDSWELALVGGCNKDHRRYVEDVREAAIGLPVSFHVNARGEDLAELYEGASVFWHAAGLGEDLEVHPDRLEHFGISTVEAMSAGAVPVVYQEGGPADLVTEGRCGRTYSTPDDLARATIALVRAPGELARSSDAAREYAERFAFDVFADGINEVVRRVGQGGVVERGDAEGGDSR